MEHQFAFNEVKLISNNKPLNWKRVEPERGRGGRGNFSTFWQFVANYICDLVSGGIFILWASNLQFIQYTHRCNITNV